MKKQKINKRTGLPKWKMSAQDSIPIQKIYDDGILRLERSLYSVTVSFTDLNYLLSDHAKKMNTLIRYCEVLNSLDSRFDFQITINKRKEKDISKSNILSKHKDDGLDKYRNEKNDYLLKIARNKNNSFKKTRYISLSFRIKDVNEARAYFNRVIKELNQNFKKMGVNLKKLNADENLELLNTFYSSEDLVHPSISNMQKRGAKITDYLAPFAIVDEVKHLKLGDVYTSVIFIKDYPSDLSDRFISDIEEQSMELTISMHIKQVQMKEGTTIVKRKIASMERDKIKHSKSSAKEGLLEAYFPSDLLDNLSEARKILDNMRNNNQNMFNFSFYIAIFSDGKDDLKEKIETLKAIARQHLITLEVAGYQQQDAFDSCLPISKDVLKLNRTLLTDSTAIFVPFSSQDIRHKNGFFYGINDTTGNMLIFNRKKLKNGSGFILGKPGSGKSFKTKEELIDILLNTDDDIIVIDPEREFTEVASNFGGEVIKISATSKNHINPMDITQNYSDDDNLVSFKTDFLLSFCECIMRELTPIQIAIIDRCIKLVYATYLKTLNKKDIPTLKDFYKAMKSQSEIEAKDISLALETYIEGGLNVFSHRTNINLNNRFIVFDTHELGNQLKPLGMLIILDAVWNILTENREAGKTTWIDIDEIYLLFRNELAAEFVYKLWKRARKYGGIPTGVTQNVEDLLKNDFARTMLSNSEFLLLMDQSESDLRELTALKELSEEQQSYVRNASAGAGLLISEGNAIPFSEEFPKDTEIYKMITTKIDEAVYKSN